MVPQFCRKNPNSFCNDLVWYNSQFESWLAAPTSSIQIKTCCYSTLIWRNKMMNCCLFKTHFSSVCGWFASRFLHAHRDSHIRICATSTWTAWVRNRMAKPKGNTSGPHLRHPCKALRRWWRFSCRPNKWNNCWSPFLKNQNGKDVCEFDDAFALLLPPE